MRFGNKNMLTRSVLHEPLKLKIKGICEGLLSCYDNVYSIFSNKHYYWLLLLLLLLLFFPVSSYFLCMIDLFIMINNMAAGTTSQVVPIWISVSQVQSFVAIIAAQWAECLCSACNIFNFFLNDVLWFENLHVVWRKWTWKGHSWYLDCKRSYS